MVRLKKGTASRLWEDLLIAVIGEQFDVGDEVCGVVISVRSQEDIISIWNKTASNREVNFKYVREWRCWFCCGCCPCPCCFATRCSLASARGSLSLSAPRVVGSVLHVTFDSRFRMFADVDDVNAHWLLLMCSRVSAESRKRSRRPCLCHTTPTLSIRLVHVSTCRI